MRAERYISLCMTHNDIIYAPVKRRGIYIPDWSKIPTYVNTVTPAVLSGMHTIGFNGAPMPGIHFAITEAVDADVLSRALYVAIRSVLNSMPPDSLDGASMDTFMLHEYYGDRYKLIDVGCNTIECGWQGACIFGQKFFDLNNQMHDMVTNGVIHPGLFDLIDGINRVVP